MKDRLTALIAVWFIVISALSCSWLRPKQPLDSFVLLEVDAPTAEREAAAQQTILIFEQRLNALGLSNFSVKVQGDPTRGQILVSLPAGVDHDRLKRILTAAGKLELTHVISPPSPAPVTTYETSEEAIASLKSAGGIPSNRRVLPYAERHGSEAEPGANGNAKYTKWVVTESDTIINSNDLRDAAAMPARGGGSYTVTFSLRRDGADKFGAWTASNINQYMGVVLNDEVKSIAFIRSQIFDSGEISGQFTKSSAEDLALVLKSGSLPFPVKFVSESTVH